MGERGRLVVVDRHDDVAVILRQRQLIEMADAVPERGTDDYRARRVGRAAMSIAAKIEVRRACREEKLRRPG
jgi:hypothetical protein